MSRVTSWPCKYSNVNANQSSSNWPMTRDTPSWSALKTTILPSWPTVTISGLLHTRPVQGALLHGKWCALGQCFEIDMVCNRDGHKCWKSISLRQASQEWSIVFTKKSMSSIRPIVPNSSNIISKYFADSQNSLSMLIMPHFLPTYSTCSVNKLSNICMYTTYCVVYLIVLVVAINGHGTSWRCSDNSLLVQKLQRNKLITQQQ